MAEKKLTTRKPAAAKAEAPKPKPKASKGVIEQLYALSDDLQAEIESHPSDFVRSALVNIRGEISHLHDTEKVAHAMREKQR